MNHTPDSFKGLPGAVGAIAVSRLSTTLHALAVATLPTGPVKHTRTPQQPSLRLVMIILFVVTIPIEIIFMATLRSIGWLTLPFLFIIFSLFFFCVAVSIIYLFLVICVKMLLPDRRIVVFCRRAYKFPLVEGSRSGCLCTASAFVNGGPHWTTSTRSLLPDCILARRKRSSPFTRL